MTQTEALKLALEALEKVVDGWTEAFAGYKYDSDIPSENQFRDEVFAAITAIKEDLAQPEHEKERCVGCEACIDTACGRDECPKGWPKAAQPEQEPVARVVEHGATVKLEWANADAAHNAKVGNLYTTPPQRKPLTDEQLLHIYVTTKGFEFYRVFARAIEKAHGIVKE